MNRVKFPLLLLFIGLFTTASAQKTVFELSNGKKTATYFQVIDFYKVLAKQSSRIKMVEKGLTDAGYPLHVVMIDNEGVFDPAKWHQQKKVVIMINNGIHPGEPDGIDASMMLVRDFATGKFKLPENVALAFIPVYNIGGFLNRQQLTRISQDGPEEYGFRGNAQNYDLNRD
ncbi:MAG TPA: M14 family zinc carboxypeptidase, partial [Ginsengibacter sp.]|nr:M14 family zinc carboxypeptidase [Ginsengibacter sp.]